MTTNDSFNSDLLAAARRRAGDADRERTADELRRAHSDGRIDSDELAERIGRCYESKTFGELQRLTADLLGPERRGSLQRFDHGGRHPRHRLRIALAAIAAVWVLAVASGAAGGHAHPHPPGFGFLLVLAFAFLVTRLVRAVRA
ncbi:MAG: DUF1707 domain-containing protein [Solirubrobacteraceae bacterium]